MIPEDIEGLALADAIGALDADEQVELQARLATLSPEVRAAVAELYDTATLVAGSIDDVEPPAYVRDRVIEATHNPGRYTVPDDSAGWAPSGLAGIRMKVLAVDRPRGMATLLIRAEAGAVYPSHRHSGPEECFVARGSVIIDGRVLHAGDFHHADEGSHHGDITTTEGADVLIVGAIADYLPS
ncbi:MAG: cupin domain-containing protein [Vicinamibacterales bacterium]